MIILKPYPIIDTKSPELNDVPWICQGHIDFHPQMKERYLGLFPIVNQSLGKKFTTILQSKWKKTDFVLYP